MKIQSTTISVQFEAVEDLRLKYLSYKNILKEHFQEPTVLPVADDAPTELPRIIAVTKNGHSQMTFTKSSVTLTTVYNDGFEDDWEKCRWYIEGKVKILGNFLHTLSVDRFKYVGLISNIEWESAGNSPTNFLENKLLKKSRKNLEDINIRYTFIDNDIYYVNILFANSYKLEGNAYFNVAGGLADKGDKYLAISVDVNDRYAFNMNKNYQSNISALDEIVKITTREFEKGIDDILETEV